MESWQERLASYWHVTYWHPKYYTGEAETNKLTYVKRIENNCGENGKRLTRVL